MTTDTSPLCTCRNGGEPYDLAGFMVISRDPGCRVHAKQYMPPAPVEEPVVDWKNRERVGK